MPRDEGQPCPICGLPLTQLDARQPPRSGLPAIAVCHICDGLLAVRLGRRGEYQIAPVTPEELMRLMAIPSFAAICDELTAYQAKVGHA